MQFVGKERIFFLAVTTVFVISAVASENHVKQLANPCRPNPCQNGGVCREEENSFVCKCPQIFSGLKCEINPCMKHPCKNGGTCAFNMTSYNCVCRNGYAGKTCEIKDDSCSKNPCQNGGTCRINGISFKCECKAPYFGEKCEKDPCTRSPCKNNGVCLIGRNSFKCFCKNPYLGEFCEKDACTEHPCKNGGICKITEYSFKCNCKASYSGPTCEDDACTDNPCLNGGTCELYGDSFKCNCIRPYSGTFCDTEITISSTVSPKFSITIGERYKTTTKSTHLFFNETTSTYVQNWTSQEPTKSSTNLNTTYVPLNFTSDMNTTTTGSKNITSDFSPTTFEPESSKIVPHNITETTINMNSTTDDLPNTMNYTEFTKSYNWTSQEPSKFTYLLNTTYVPPNTTFVMNITTIRPRICSKNSDCLNGGFCRSIKRFEYFCDCPPNFTGERCEINLCGQIDRFCDSLGAICKTIGQNAICECPPRKIHNPVTGICEDTCVLQQCFHGSCERAGKYYRCNCHEGYTGFHCNEVVRNKKENYSALITTVTSFLLFIFLLLTGASYLIYKIHLTLKTYRIPEITN